MAYVIYLSPSTSNEATETIFAKPELMYYVCVGRTSILGKSVQIVLPLCHSLIIV